MPDQWYSMPSDVVQKGSDYFLLDAQAIPTLAGPQASPQPGAVPTGPVVVTVTPTYTIPPPPPGGIQPVEPSPSPQPTPSPCQAPPPCKQ